MGAFSIPDPYAAIATPTRTGGKSGQQRQPAQDDPYAHLATATREEPSPAQRAIPVPALAPTAPPQQGFLSSFADASGLSGLGHALMHPADTAKAVWDATSDDNIKAAVRGKVAQLKQIDTDIKQHNGMTAYHTIQAIPLVGPAMDRASDQVATNPNQGYVKNLGHVLSSPGAMGTLAGAAATLAPVGAQALKLAGAGDALSSVAGKIPIPSDITLPIPTRQSVKLAGTKLLAPGTVGETLVRATKPSVTFGPAGDVASSLESSFPKAIAQNPNIRTVSDLGQAYDAAADATSKQYQSKIAPYRGGLGTAPRPLAVDGNPIADAQIRSIPAINLLEDTSGNGIVSSTADKAAAYRGPLSVPTLDDVRVDANQKLNAFYNKQGGDAAAALSNPETARIKAIGDTTRDILYPAVEADQGLPAGSLADTQRQFGQLTDAGNIANRRSLVFGRQDPVSLAEKIAVGHGGPLTSVFNWAKEHAIQGMTNSDGLVQSAVDRVANPGGPLSSLRAKTISLPLTTSIPPVPLYTGPLLQSLRGKRTAP